jgi:hypothetical protein
MGAFLFGQRITGTTLAAEAFSGCMDCHLPIPAGWAD